MTRPWKGHTSHIPLSQEEKWNVFPIFQTILGLGKESGGERIGLASVGFPHYPWREWNYSVDPFSLVTLAGENNHQSRHCTCDAGDNYPSTWRRLDVLFPIRHKQRSEVTGTNCWQLLPSLNCHQPSRIMRFPRKPPGSPSSPPLSCFTSSFQKRHWIRKTVNMQLYCNIQDVKQTERVWIWWSGRIADLTTFPRGFKRARFAAALCNTVRKITARQGINHNPLSWWGAIFKCSNRQEQREVTCCLKSKLIQPTSPTKPSNADLMAVRINSIRIFPLHFQFEVLQPFCRSIPGVYSSECYADCGPSPESIRRIKQCSNKTAMGASTKR